MSAAPGILNLTLPQGATWDVSLTYTDGAGNPFNLTGSSARMQARQSYDSATPIFSLTNGTGINLGGTAGTIDIIVAATATAGYAAGQYVYDLEIESSSVVTRVIQGSLFITPEVTR